MPGTITCYPNGFNRDRAIELGKLVQQAYEQFQKSKDHQAWHVRGPYDNLVEFSARPDSLFSLVAPEPFGFVARSQVNGGVHVVFRGTQSPADWIANLRFPQTPNTLGGQHTLGGKVEVGFSFVYGQCSGVILAKLRELKTAGTLQRLDVTGHSLGGALATLCAADIVSQPDLIPPQLYTFASPRTGDRHFAAAFNSKCPDTWRTVNTEDIVNTVPLATPMVAFLHEPLKAIFASLTHLEYEHVGTPVDFTKHNETIIDNHKMETYIAALEASMAIGG